MNTEQLKELGLTDDQAKGVMALKGEVVKQEQTKLQAEIDKVTAERDGLNEQIAQRDKDIKELKKAAGDNEELSTKLADLQKQYDDETKALTAKLEATKLDSALTEALAATKARDPQDLKAFLNMDEIKLGEDGKVVGLDDQIKTLQENKAYLFDGGKQPGGYNPPKGGSAGGTADLAEAMKADDFNMTEWAKSQKQGE